MNIWIDLANSPQVLFFQPIIRELVSRGFKVEITTRAYAQTVDLSNKLSIPHTLIGQHGGNSLVRLMIQNFIRALELTKWSLSRHFDLALSHNSYSQVVSSSLIKIPSVTLMDYEHQPLNHISFRLAKRVIVPEVFPVDYIVKYGAKHKTLTYPGIKEQVYLADFIPQPKYRFQQGFPDDRSLVVIRPPAPWTAYHRFDNDVFDGLLKILASKPDKYLLFLPRTPQQAESVKNLSGIIVADRTFDGPNLLHCADSVISGGGTMNREAAVLGTPTYTVFKGKASAVDQFLIRGSRMVQISNLGDIENIRFDIKRRNMDHLLKPKLVHHVTNLILDQ